jgi:hypothetical protein
MPDWKGGEMLTQMHPVISQTFPHNSVRKSPTRCSCQRRYCRRMAAYSGGKAKPEAYGPPATRLAGRSALDPYGAADEQPDAKSNAESDE